MKKHIIGGKHYAHGVITTGDFGTLIVRRVAEYRDGSGDIVAFSQVFVPNLEAFLMLDEFSTLVE